MAAEQWNNSTFFNCLIANHWMQLAHVFDFTLVKIIRRMQFVASALANWMHIFEMQMPKTTLNISSSSSFFF